MNGDENLPDRARVFVRMWRVLVLLRCAPHTLDELAEKLRVCTRTIRRDLKALQAVPLPVVGVFPESSRKGIQAQQPQRWMIGELPAWPEADPVPAAELAPGEVRS
jgi:hypothetical protein